MKGRKTVQKMSRIFTLLELLIVISVISILVAMLLPALRSAREKARAALCMGNQKQVFLFLQNYTDDFDGFSICPNQKIKEDDAEDYAWGYNLSRLYKNNRLLVGTKANGPEFFCPSAPFPEGTAVVRNMTYGLCGREADLAPVLWKSTSARRGLLIKKLRQPGEWGWIGDSWLTSARRPECFLPIFGIDGAIGFNPNPEDTAHVRGVNLLHNRTSNLLMVAGNVRVFSAAALEFYATRTWNDSSGNRQWGRFFYFMF